jgi:GNAT superfamily N-acetyltransferase
VSTFNLQILDGSQSLRESDVNDLVELIHDAIHHHHSVGFLLSTTKAELGEFWLEEISDLKTRNTFVIARIDNRIVGIVILSRETRPNGRHRAELRKLIVHSNFQRLGIGKALVDEATLYAKTLGLSLLYLDSATDFLVDTVYESWGWQKAGSIPDYSSKPDGTLEPTTYFYKKL